MDNYRFRSATLN